MEKIFKSCVVGMGGIGHTHARCYKENPLAELVAVCDVIKEKADEAAAEFGCRAFYDEEDMLKNMPEIDVVSVTTSSRSASMGGLVTWAKSCLK